MQAALRRTEPELALVSRSSAQLGPLDEPGITFTPTGLNIEPWVKYKQWAQYGRKLQLAEKGIQWALGDWIIHGERHFKDRAEEAVEFTGLKLKTLQNYATVAEGIKQSRRRDSDLVDFSTHAEIASLPDEEQERILAMAESDPVAVTSRVARREASRVKRRLGGSTSELEILATPEVQQFLDDYIVRLKEAEETLPGTATFLRNMIERHQSQALWQKGRTVSGDCDVILTAIDETGGLSDDDLFTWLQNRGYFMRDPELDDRLTYMVEHQMILEDDAGQDGRQEGRRGKLPTFYVRWYKKRTKVQRCKVCDEYHKDDADCLELSILTD